MRFNKLIPELSVSDFDNSLQFYVDILGFTIDYQRKDFAHISFKGSQIMIQKDNAVWNTGNLSYPYGRGINFQIEVDDIEPIQKFLKDNSIALFTKPKESWYRVDNEKHGVREFLVQDPDGYLLRFSQNIGVKNDKTSKKS